MLKRIGWGVSGRAYERLLQALDRLQSTTIKTNIRANSKTRETTFSWIDSYTHLVDERTQLSLGMEITLSKWFFEGVIDRRNILSISPLYFEITSGLGKWLYRASRKHAGGNGADGFTIGFETLHQKSGSESSLPSFKNKIVNLAKANNLPEISLEVIGPETPRPKLKMVMRRHLENNEASPKANIPNKDSAEGQPSQTSAQSTAQATPRSGDRKSSAVSTGRNTGGFGRAKRLLDPDVYQMIKADCPGWDLDVLLQQFDEFLNANPDELPRNYSKRFYGFVKRHHERNRFQLRGR
jgi:hypothetical protein